MIRAGFNSITRNGYCTPRGLARTAMLLALVLGGAVALAQADDAVIKRPAELREGPGEAARSLAALPVQTPVTRLGPRQGPWQQVRTASGTTGWVHLFDLGTSGTTASAPASGGNAATGALRGLSNFFNRRSSPATSLPTSTVGIRGLGAEDLAKAQPNLAAVGQMEALRQNEAQARAFASAAALTALDVPPLPAPARPATQPEQGQP